MNPVGFKPTPSQVGHAIGGVVAELTRKLAAGVDPDALRDAGLTAAQYSAEMLLFAASAAMHAVESSGLAPEEELEVAAGLFSWARELAEPSRALLLEMLDESTDMYADAVSVDAENPRDPEDLPEIEAVFGERLLGLGENNETRGHACVRLCLAVPRTMWSVQYASANQMLVDAGLRRRQ